MTKAEADRLLRNALERHRKGEVEAASRVYREVLAELPDHPTALHYMGLVAHHSGETDKAVELLRRSIRLDSKDPRAYNHLGQIVLGQNQVLEAIACFRRAIEVDPRHVESINNLANVLALSGQRGNAIELYRRALELNPRAISSLYNLANALKDEAAHEEAMELFTHALRGASRSCALAPQSRACCSSSRAGSRKPSSIIRPCAACSRSTSNRSRTCSRSVPTVLMSARSMKPSERLGAKDVADDDRVKLHSGLGKYYDRQQRYDEAFAHFRSAKATVRKLTGTFDERALAAYFDRIIDTFSLDFFGRFPAGGSSSQRPRVHRRHAALRHYADGTDSGEPSRRCSARESCRAFPISRAPCAPTIRNACLV